jgi:hypothetical protein
MRHLHYPICITRNWWPSVEAGSTDSIRIALWVCYILFWAYRVGICWLWIAVCKSLTNYLIYKTKTCGRSVDAWGVAALRQTILPIQAANTSIMGKCHSTALGLYKMQHTKLLTLCWRSFSDWGWDHVAIYFAHNGYHSVNSKYMSLQSPRIIQDATLKIIHALLTLCWRYVDALLILCWCCVDALLMLILRCSSIGTHDIAYKGCQYIDYGYMP